MRRSARFWAAAIGLALASPVRGEPLPLSVTPIETFALAADGAPAEALAFLGGLEVTSDDRRFGGLSGIEFDSDGNAIIVSDTGMVIRARLETTDDRLTGLADATMQRLLLGETTAKRTNDVEDIAFDPADTSRGVIVRESQANAMLDFAVRDGRLTDFRPRRVGAPNRILRTNRGLESVTYAPAASHLSGAIVAIAERPPRGAVDIPGWIAGVGGFDIVRRDDFDISAARFLPDGDLLLLERRYTPPLGIAARLRRVDGDAIAVGARLDGTIIFEASGPGRIDNMEGLAVHQDADGRTILTMVSDDNHSILQRTLILQFVLNED